MGVFNTRPRFDDTQIKQLTGDTITLSGTTNISGTFRYIPGATTGNFLKASDPQGTLEWSPISGITWAISACTSPLYVSTIEACPNPTDPLYIEAGEVQFGTSPNSIITDITNTRVGVGTGSPTERLHVSGGNILLNNNLDGRASITVDNFSVSNDASSILRVCVSGNSLSQCAYGVVSAYGPDAAPTGSFGGSYLPNSLTIATSNGTQPERLHINIGSRRAGDAQTRFFGGSNDFDSSSLLGVFYTSGLTITDTLNTDTLRVRDGATSGYVLTSDAQGNASWQPAASGTTGGATIDPYNDVGTTTTINWDVSGTSTNYEVTLNGNGTLNLQNVRNGDYGTIIVEQDGVGGHTLAFGTINGGAGTHRVVNGGAGAPTLTVNANAIDILSFTYNGSAMYWTVGNDYT